MRLKYADCPQICLTLVFNIFVFLGLKEENSKLQNHKSSVSANQSAQSYSNIDVKQQVYRNVESLKSM